MPHLPLPLCSPPSPCLHRRHVEDNNLCGIFYFKGDLVPLPPCPPALAASALAPSGAPDTALGACALCAFAGLVGLLCSLCLLCLLALAAKPAWRRSRAWLFRGNAANGPMLG